MQNLFPRRNRKQNTGNELQRSSVRSELLVCQKKLLIIVQMTVLYLRFLYTAEEMARCGERVCIHCKCTAKRRRTCPSGI